VLRRLVIALPFVAALALSACSDDDYSNTPSGSTADLSAVAHDLAGTADLSNADLADAAESPTDGGSQD
jgi:hypothetical protein